MAQKEIGSFISELRKKASMTQQGLANRINVTDKAVSKWERGVSTPDIDVIPKLAEIFGITVEELMAGKQREEVIQKFMYEFVKVAMEKHGIITKAKSSRHQEIINAYAEKGYRYAGLIPTYIEESGIMVEMDLVFEKPE